MPTPPLSRRGAAMPPSPIRKLVPLADEAKARGVHVHHLNIGQPDVPTPPAFFDAVRAYPERVLAYGHSAGLAVMREKMAAYYRRRGYEGIGPAEVTVTTAGSEAIQFALMATCDPGDEVLCFEPFYTNYNSYALQAGVTLRALTCRVEDGYHLPARDAVEAAVGPRTRAILCCSPNNPTGTVLSRAEMEALAAVARAHDLFLLGDEAYREFVYGDAVHTGVLELPDVADRAVLMDTLSKRYSLCGARVGCLVTRNADLGRAFLHLGMARLCPPSLEQYGALPLFDLGDDYFRGVQAEYQRRRDVVMEGLARIPGAYARTPEGAFYVMARLPVQDSGHFARWLLTDFRHEGETVMLAPGDGFYATPGRGHDEVRLAYVVGTAELRRAMDCLAAALRQYDGIG